VFLPVLPIVYNSPFVFQFLKSHPNVYLLTLHSLQINHPKREGKGRVPAAAPDPPGTTSRPVKWGEAV
jgi:hypothetical protein